MTTQNTTALVQEVQKKETVKDFTFNTLKRTVTTVTEKVTLITIEERIDVLEELDTMSYNGLESLLNDDFFKNYALCYQAKQTALKAIKSLYPIDEGMTEYEQAYNKEMQKGLREYLRKNAYTSKISKSLEISILNDSTLYPNEEVREKLVTLCKQAGGSYALGRTLVKYYESKNKMPWKRVKGLTKNLLKPVVISRQKWERSKDNLKELYDICKNDLQMELQPIDTYHYRTLQKIARGVMYSKFILIDEELINE